jgi:hypothetical protein
MKPLTNCIATKLFRLGALLSLLMAASPAFAAAMAGKVTHLSGPLLAKKPDGAVKVLSQQSAVEEGDTLVTEKSTYARIKFIDDSEITLKPGSQFKIDSFSFEPGNKSKDSATFSLVKGGLRSVTGLLGKRSKERFGLNTPTATIGIRGTTFIVEYVINDSKTIADYGSLSVATSFWTPATTYDFASANAIAGLSFPTNLKQILAQNSTPGQEGRQPGLYIFVSDGGITLNNGGGSQNVGAGEYGYAGNPNLPPVKLPGDPGMQFNLPNAFSSEGNSAGGRTSSQEGVDCEVR